MRRCPRAPDIGWLSAPQLLPKEVSHQIHLWEMQALSERGDVVSYQLAPKRAVESAARPRACRLARTTWRPYERGWTIPPNISVAPALRAREPGAGLPLGLGTLMAVCGCLTRSRSQPPFCRSLGIQRSRLGQQLSWRTTTARQETGSRTKVAGPLASS
jgi:hypothetical protein